MVIIFPIKGIHKGAITSEQPELTTPSMNNMRPFDQLAERARGGQRPGLEKWGAGVQIGDADNPVIAMCSVTSIA